MSENSSITVKRRIFDGKMYSKKNLIIHENIQICLNSFVRQSIYHRCIKFFPTPTPPPLKKDPKRGEWVGEEKREEKEKGKRRKREGKEKEKRRKREGKEKEKRRK